MMSVLRSSSAAAIVVTAALAASAAATQGAARKDCQSSPSSRPKVGTLSKILHTAVGVGGRYVATAPCDLRAGDVVSTDSRGQALFALDVDDLETTCVVLPVSAAGVYRESKSKTQVVLFGSGRSWCVVRGRRGAPFSAVVSGMRAPPQLSLLTPTTRFGVDVGTGSMLVKVNRGSVRIQTARDSSTVIAGKAARVSTNGVVRVDKAVLDAQDGLALAQLR